MAINAEDWERFWSEEHQAWYLANKRTGKTTWIGLETDVETSHGLVHHVESHQPAVASKTSEFGAFHVYVEREEISNILGLGLSDGSRGLLVTVLTEGLVADYNRMMNAEPEPLCHRTVQVGDLITNVNGYVDLSAMWNEIRHSLDLHFRMGRCL